MTYRVAEWACQASSAVCRSVAEKIPVVELSKRFGELLDEEKKDGLF